MTDYSEVTLVKSATDKKGLIIDVTHPLERTMDYKIALMRNEIEPIIGVLQKYLEEYDCLSKTED